MAQTQHTPGPWRFEGDTDNLVIIGRPTWPCRRNGKDGEWSIATVEDLEFDNFGSEDEAYANARLIAAAPDLLAVLRRVDDLMDFDGSDYPQFDGLQEQMKAAIAKAEGSTNA